MTIWDPFGPIWTILDHFKQELIFCSEAPLPNPPLSITGKTSFFSEMVQNGPDGPKRVPSGQKHLGWPFWSLLDHFDKLKSLPCLAIFGPKWTIFGPSPMMSGGHQSKKRLITTSSMCGLLVEPQFFPFGTYTWSQSMKNVKNRSQFHEKMAVFSHYLVMNGKLWVRNKFSTHIKCQR